MCGEEHFFNQDKISVCDGCDESLVKPLLLCADKKFPLFLESVICENDLWQFAASNEPFAKIVRTCYKEKMGLLMLRESVFLAFPDGGSVEFKKGKVAPLFMNAIYQYQNKEFSIQEDYI
jgi:hypothetical protein